MDGRHFRPKLALVLSRAYAPDAENPVDASRHDEALDPRSVPHRGARKRSGVVDVLVGYDGSDESRAAVDLMVKDISVAGAGL